MAADILPFESKINAALQPLIQEEKDFLITQICESIGFGLICELESLYEDELRKSDCDIAKVARLAESARALKAIQEENESKTFIRSSAFILAELQKLKQTTPT